MLLEARELKKVYSRGSQSVEALKGVSLAIDPGQFISIMGTSGSGKSTLMHCLGGLDRPSSGKILVGDRDIAALSDDELSEFRRRKLGFIFQFFNLIPTMTALENVMLPMLLDDRSSRAAEPKAKELLKLVGLGARGDHRPSQLSGGEMQRVAIARAFISDPVLILADEPTGNLDSRTGVTVLELLRSMVKDLGHTIVMVTHDPKAATYGNRIVTLKDGVIESDRPC